jgi:hypothetical protein
MGLGAGGIDISKLTRDNEAVGWFNWRAIEVKTMTYRAIGRILLRILGWLVITLVAVIGLGFVLGSVEDLLEVKAAERTYSLLVYAPYELPTKVEITIDGFHTEFHRGDRAFDELVNRLREGRSEEMIEKAEAIGLSGREENPVCGEIVTWGSFIPDRSQIYRDTGNHNVYWIWVRKLNGWGKSRPFFTVDPRVIEFIKANGTK